jgi:hypothetical protein
MRILKNIQFLTALTGMLCVFGLVSSCKKDTPAITKTIIEHDTVQHAWQAEPEFNNLDQDISTAFAANGKVFFYGTQYYYYVYDSISNGWGIANATNPLSNRRPAINRDFFAMADINNNFGFTDPFISSQPSYSNTFKTFDTNFVSFPTHLVNYNLTGSVDISDSDRVLFPVLTTDGTKNYFYLLDVKLNYSNYQYTISNFHKLTLGLLNGVSKSISTVHIKNRFLISANDTLYLVREDYSSKLLMSGSFLSVFTYNTVYYAINNNGAIYQTTDNGETWVLQYTLSMPGVTIINFDAKLIAISGGQFWEVTLTSTSIALKEINNDGLAGKTITGLVKCNNKVWITTNGGVFYRPYSQFYQYK